MATEKRLIDVLEFAKRCDRLLENPLHIHPGTSWQRGIDMAVAEAFLMRPVDAVEVVHGRWIEKKLDDFRMWEVRCSECGWVGISNYDAYDEPYDFNYCPNCGAKLDGGNEDG